MVFRWEKSSNVYDVRHFWPSKFETFEVGSFCRKWSNAGSQLFEDEYEPQGNLINDQVQKFVLQNVEYTSVRYAIKNSVSIVCVSVKHALLTYYSTVKLIFISWSTNFPIYYDSSFWRLKKPFFQYTQRIIIYVPWAGGEMSLTLSIEVTFL